MRIAFILSRDPNSSGGGVISYIKNISKELLKKGIEVIIISPKETNKPPFEYIKVGSRHKGNIGFLFHLLLKVPFMNLTSDTILCANRADFLFPFILFRRNNRKGILIHGNQHGGVAEKSRVCSIIYSHIEKYVMKNTHFVMFIGRQSQKDYIGLYDNLLKNKLTEILPVGAHSPNFRLLNKMECRKLAKLPQNKKIIIFVGRFEQEKRPDLAIEAFNEISKKFKDVILVLIGDGSKKKELVSMVEKYGLTKKVVFTGMVNNDKIPIYLNSSNLFLLTSKRENGPIVTKEALACGVPVVSTKVGDIEEYIHSKLGILIESTNVQAIEQAISKALTKEWDRDYIAKYAQRFRWSKISKRLIAFFNTKWYKNDLQ